MKTKLLSVFLVLAMLMTSVLCVLPASAVEADYDALAKAEGYVCRVGEPNADFTGYYKFFSAADTGYTEDQPNALVAAFGSSNEATITLIDTIHVSQEVKGAVDTKFLHTSVAIPSGKTSGNGNLFSSKELDVAVHINVSGNPDRACKRSENTGFHNQSGENGA